MNRHPRRPLTPAKLDRLDELERERIAGPRVILAAIFASMTAGGLIAAAVIGRLA